MSDLLSVCPKCQHGQSAPRADCEVCGVIFAKLERRREVPSAPPASAFEPSFERFLLEHDRLYVEQHARHWYEILLNWEQRNEYRVKDVSHRSVGWIVEQGKGLVSALLRVFAGSHRPFEILVLSLDEDVLLEFRREFFFFFSSMQVVGPAGQLFGRIERRFSIFNREYDLVGPRGRLFARIKSPLFKVWTFPVLDPSGQERAMIAKKWSGLRKEYFTDADNFGVDFGSHPWTPEQRAVIFAASIAIDFDFFENNQQR